MTRTTLEQDDLKGTAMAVPAAARRSEQPDLASGDDEPDVEADTTSILHGAAAATGKASWSAARVAQTNEALALYEVDRKRRETLEAAEEARELAHLAAWNAETTVVGGVQMTNEEAQTARKRVLANADAYVDRAIAKGDLDESERGEFKRWMARKIELEDMRGRGTITAAGRQEEADGDRTRAGRIADVATGIDHQLRDAALSASAPSATNASLRSSGAQALADYDVFQAKASTPANGPQQTEPALSAKVQATGLTL